MRVPDQSARVESSRKKRRATACGCAPGRILAAECARISRSRPTNRRLAPLRFRFSGLRTIYGQLRKVQRAFSVRKRHQRNDLGFWTQKLRTRGSGVRVSPGAPVSCPSTSRRAARPRNSHQPASPSPLVSEKDGQSGTARDCLNLPLKIAAKNELLTKSG
jgi:hypothetical protein